MIHNRTLRIFFVYMTFFLIVSLTCVNLAAGCSKKPAKSPPKSSDSEKKESSALKKLQSGTESVIKEYEKTYLIQTAPPPKAPTTPKKPEESQEKTESKQQEQGEKEGEDKKEKEGDQGQEKSSQNQTTATQPNWPKLEKDIAKIHEQWNGFQSEAIKSGASLEMINDFSDTLNKLTMTLTRQELYEGLLAVNDLYGKTIDFEKLFKTKSPPDTKKILYYGRVATYKILNNDDIGAKEAMDSALMTWETVKPQVKDTTEASKMEFALKELSQAIKEKDPNLIKIKAQIGEKNAQDVIKSMEKSK
jgi:hypothetical protein